MACEHSGYLWNECSACHKEEIKSLTLALNEAEKLAILAQDLTKKILFGRGANVFWASREILSSIKALKKKYG